MPSQYSDAHRHLLEKILHGQSPLRAASEVIPRRDPQEPIPLSFSQEQVWLHAQLTPEVPVYNEPVTIHHHGDLNVPTLERSFNEILRRHEAWRTFFTIVDGEPRQNVQPEVSVSLPVIDLRHFSEEHRESAALNIATEDAQKPINLAQAPLFRAKLIRFQDKEYRLYLSLSHIIFDGVAIYRIFLPELAELYSAQVGCRTPLLPEIKVQFPDYSCWQRKSWRPGSFAEHQSYWHRQLNDVPVLDLPSDYPRLALQTFRGSMYPFALCPRLTDAARSLSRSEGVTLFQTLLAVFAALLCRYSGQEDLPIGSVTAGRDLPETKNLLGYFLNTVALRIDLSNDPPFRDLLRSVQNLTLEALEHDSVPFGMLIQDLNVSRDLSRNPLIQVMFSLEPPMPDLDSSWHLTQMDVDTGATKYDLYLELDERRDSILARFHYSTDLFHPATIARMAEHWMTLIDEATSDSSLRVSQLPMLADKERAQLVIEWNQTKSQEAAPKQESQGIATVFDIQCARTPDSVALSEGEKHLSFRQLHERTNRVAHYLKKLGARKGTRVALYLERSIDTAPVLLSILKTGASYVPLDLSNPIDRIAFMLKDSDPVVLISQQKLLSDLPVRGITTVNLDADWPKIARESAENVTSDVRPEDPAYVLYTSGSSGRPKGVEGTHGGALNRMRWMWERYPFGAGEVCCQKTNVGFVDSVWEIFGPLLAGVPSVIVGQETVLDPEELLRTLAEQHVTRMVLVPSLLRAVLEHAPDLGERVPELKLWSCSGEVLTWELARRFQKAHPQATLLNIYGSSEVAADVTWHEVGEEAEGEAQRQEGSTSVPIGKPIGNSQVYVLDQTMNPVPVGVRGEIYVGGDGLALGYWRQPELTAERFVRNPFARERWEKLYRTGDVGRWRRTGELEYVGRRDSEVKVRGMRIELGEIETVLGTHAWVEEAVVELSGEGGEQQRLVAYVVGAAEGGEAPGARELRRYVRTKLPEHMVPAKFVRVEAMPLLASGKVNRQGLKAVAGIGLKEQEEVAQPKTEVEKKLAGMWVEVLKVNEVGVDQNFFELGGHSLLVLQVMARIRREFGVELGVRTMFEEPTIAGLAGEVEKARALGVELRTPALARRARPAPGNGEAGRAALLAQLDTLSADDVQTLLKRVLDAKLSNG
jgi:amino acid adenylation domain-containing protein